MVYGTSYGTMGGTVIANRPVATPTTASATLIVDLPADATLTVDGHATKSTSSQRRFVSPPLDRNGNYTYTLQATVMRDGAPITMTKEVAVRPGQETRIQMEVPAASVASGR